MQPGSEFDQLRQKLDTLDSADITDTWDRQAAWHQLAERLPRRKRVVSVWLYPAAAAAILLLGIRIGMEMNTGAKTVVTTPAGTTKSAVAITAEKSPPDVKETVNAIPITAPDTQLVVTQQQPGNRTKKQESALPVVRQELLPIPVVDAPVVVSNTREQTAAPEVVYTMDEIMDNAPEKAEPPKIYTGIFKRRPVNESNEAITAKEAAARRKFEETYKIY